MGCLGIILAVLGLLSVDVLITIGALYLIALCFGWTFSWKIAIGVWLVIGLLRSAFKGGKK